MNHTFNVLLAQKYGLDESIFIQTLVFWTATNAAQGEESNIHFQEERYWSFGTPEYLCKFFPYWKPRRVKDIIKSCLNNGLILKGVFNKKGYDRTNWYSLSDSALLELNLDKTCLKPAPSLIGRNPSDPLDEIRPIHWTEFVRPIPITKPITKPYKNNIGDSGESPEMDYSEFDEQLENSEVSDTAQIIRPNFETAAQAVETKTDPTKSDYSNTQLNKCADSKKVTPFGLTDLLSENIFNIPEQALQDWIETRKKKKAPITKTAWTIINKELAKCKEQGTDPIEAFETMVASGWQSLKVGYFENPTNPKAAPKFYQKPGDSFNQYMNSQKQGGTTYDQYGNTYDPLR